RSSSSVRPRSQAAKSPVIPSIVGSHPTGPPPWRDGGDTGGDAVVPAERRRRPRAVPGRPAGETRRPARPRKPRGDPGRGGGSDRHSATYRGNIAWSGERGTRPRPRRRRPAVPGARRGTAVSRGHFADTG